MDEPVITRCGPELFAKVAIMSGDPGRVLNVRGSANSPDDSFAIDLYVAIIGTDPVGAISLVTIPDHPAACVIDFLYAGKDGGAKCREKLLALTDEFNVVLAAQVAAPSLVTDERYRMLDDLFVRTNTYLTEEELKTIWTAYRANVPRLHCPLVDGKLEY